MTKIEVKKSKKKPEQEFPIGEISNWKSLAILLDKKRHLSFLAASQDESTERLFDVLAGIRNGIISLDEGEELE